MSLLSVKANHINIQICGDIGAICNCDGRIWRVTGNQIIEQIICKAEANVVRDFVGTCCKVGIVGCNRKREFVLLVGDGMVEVATKPPVFFVGGHPLHYTFIVDIFVVLVKECLLRVILEASEVLVDTSPDQK